MMVLRVLTIQPLQLGLLNN